MKKKNNKAKTSRKKKNGIRKNKKRHRRKKRTELKDTVKLNTGLLRHPPSAPPGYLSTRQKEK